MFRMSFSLRETFNLRLVLAILVICISQIGYGFDNTGYGSIQAIDAFIKQFGTYDPKKGTYGYETTWLSMFNFFGFIGLFVGVNIGSMVSKRWGRRMCMFSMSCWGLVTATITITSTTSEQIMVGRVLNYVYTGMELAVVPVYQSEITPKAARGFVVGTYQLCLVIGGLLIQAICYSVQDRKDSSAYHIPFGMFYLIPSFVICAIWFIPESPRWLVMKDRHEEARRSLTLLRQGKFTQEQMDEELEQVTADLQRERGMERGVFTDIFKGFNLRRTLIVWVANFFLQATGQSFASQYGALFIKSLGTVNQFSMQMGISSIAICTTISSMFCVDTLGRRKMLMIGGTIQAAALMTMGGLGTASEQTYTIRSAIVGMMVVFQTGYMFGWAPIVHTLSAELPSNALRDITYRTGTLINVATNFTVAFTLPYLLNPPYANLNSRVGFIYGSIATCSIVFAYLAVPECRGRSLEDVNRLFESGAALRHFHKVKLDSVTERDDNGSDKDQVKVSVADDSQRV